MASIVNGMEHNIRNKGAASKPRIMVAGATGYIGRAVVQELVKRKVECVSMVRPQAKIPENIAKYLEGSNLMAVDVLNRDAAEQAVFEYEPTSVICCLASRDGLGKNAWKVDYGGGVIC